MTTNQHQKNERLNFLFERSIGYFSDKDTITPFSEMIQATKSTLVQADILPLKNPKNQDIDADSRLLLLTYSELYLVQNCKDENGGMFKIEGVLGLKKDSNLKSTP